MHMRAPKPFFGDTIQYNTIQYTMIFEVHKYNQYPFNHSWETLSQKDFPICPMSSTDKKMKKMIKHIKSFFSTVVEYSCSPGCCGISWLGQDLLHDSSPSFQLFTQDDLNYSKRIALSIYHRHSLSSILLLAIFRSLPCSTDMRALKTKMLQYRNEKWKWF